MTARILDYSNAFMKGLIVALVALPVIGTELGYYSPWYYSAMAVLAALTVAWYRYGRTGYGGYSDV